MKNKKINSLKIRWIITASALFITIAVGLIVKFNPNFADWYAFSVYPVLVNIFARISGIFSFSVAEFIIAAAVLTALSAIIYFIVNVVKRKSERKRFILSSISTATAVLSCIAVLFMFSCGINYYRSPFSYYSGIKVERYTKDQVYETLEYIITEINKIADYVEVDENGDCILPEDLYSITTDAMYNISEQYPSLKSFYPSAKPLLVSPIMCYTKIVGIFTPYSMEANYNTCETTDGIGYTICHELSHMTGFMREDEANFISYIACRESGNIYLMYSGYMNAMKNLLNAYYPETDNKGYAEIFCKINPKSIMHINRNNEFWSKFDTPVAEVSTAINDTYLKVNNQSDGTKSYGRMTDLVIAEYLQNKKK